MNGKHPGCRGKQCCQIPVFIVTIDCVLCEVRDKKKWAEFWAYDTAEYSICKARTEAEENFIIESLINVAQPEGGVLTDEISSRFTQR